MARSRRLEALLQIDLSAGASDIGERVLACESGCALLLCYLWHYPRTAMTSEDLAGIIGRPPMEVEGALVLLEQLGVVERRRVGPVTLYRLAEEEMAKELVHEFCIWREEWQQRLRDVAALLQLEGEG